MHFRGISLPDFFSTLAHAMASCERTVILEHNRQSLDFREEISTMGTGVSMMIGNRLVALGRQRNSLEIAEMS